MEAGQIILILGMMLLLFDLIVLFKKKKLKTSKDPSFYVAVAAFFIMLAAYGVFVNAFVSDDFSIEEVYSHSSSSLSILSKFYAAWAGSGGSILLLTILLAMAYFGLRWKANGNPNYFNFFSSKTIGIILAFFLLLCIMKNPFATFVTAVPQEGAGLNPALQTVWMVVHPPIVFIAYAFLVLTFILVLAGMRTGEQKEEKLLRLSAGISWFFFTVGIALGGLWAYEVLGWGGYWSWDPVETSSLLPWLALTAFFLLSRNNKQKIDYSKEFLILIAFDALIFLSALTRGGLLMSVHAYALSPAGPILLLFALAVTIYFFYLKRKTNKPLFPLNYDRSSMHSISSFLTIFAILGIFIVCLAGVVVPLVHARFTPDPITPTVSFYNMANLPFVLLLLLAYVGRGLPEKVNMKSAVPIFLIVAISAILVAAVWPTSNWIANLGIPWVIGAVAALSYRLVKDLSKQTRILRIFGFNLLHLGLVLTLIGIFISGGAGQTVNMVNGSPNSTTNVLDMELVFSNAIPFISEGDVELSDGIYFEYVGLKIDTTVTQAGNIYATALDARLYPALGMIIAPSIVRTAGADIYMHLDQSSELTNSLMTAASGNFTQPSNFTLTVKVIPMVNLVWIGCAILSIGAIFLIAGELSMKATSETNQTKRKAQE